jgi:hypothetical protein
MAVAINFDTPVTAIEGIGSVTEQRLAAADIFTVNDLLSCTVEQIHAQVKHITSLKQVEKWQMMARLAQINAMSLQWAEGLVRGNIETIEELAFQTVDHIRSVLTKAYNEGFTPDVPSVDNVIEIVRDDLRIHYTGSLNLTVRTPDGGVLSGAMVFTGGSNAKTDARGRARVIRIPLGQPTTLRVEHPNYGLLVLHDVLVSSDPFSLHVLEVVVPRRGDENDADAKALSEYAGDVLGAASNAPYRAVTHSENDLRDGDLLLVSYFYTVSADLKLVSLLRDYIAGEVVVYQYRVSCAAFDVKPTIKGLYIFKDGKFLRLRSNRRVIHLYRIIKSCEKIFNSNLEIETSKENMDNEIRRFEYCFAQGAFIGFRRGLI